MRIKCSYLDNYILNLIYRTREIYYHYLGIRIVESISTGKPNKNAMKVIQEACLMQIFLDNVSKSWCETSQAPEVTERSRPP